jgi:hypothetical protein
MGVTIKPVTLPSGLPEQDLGNPVVQQFAGEGMETVEAATTEDPLSIFSTSDTRRKSRSTSPPIPGKNGKASIPQDVVQGLVAPGSRSTSRAA